MMASAFRSRVTLKWDQRAETMVALNLETRVQQKYCASVFRCTSL